MLPTNLQVPVEELRYGNPLASSPLFALLYFSLLTQKHAPKTTTNILPEYDYIVVGSGAGGGTVAGRLSEVPCINVLLIEAGDSPPVMTEVPGTFRSVVGTDMDWKDLTVPQKHAGSLLKNRQFMIPTGKALGGCTAHNSMAYVRGDKQIFNQWEELGAEGWNYWSVLPYFKKAEMNKNPDVVDIDYHGFFGPNSVELSKFEDPYKTATEQAAQELGYTFLDVNGENAKGFYRTQYGLNNGQRCGVAKSYLVPAENRTNFNILKNALVTKVLISRNKAVGIIFNYFGVDHVVYARREVIISAGPIRSPQILMLSGIGPEEHLQDMGIQVIADLPVGDNLHDHVGAINPYYTEKLIPVSEKIVDLGNIEEYIQRRSGYLANPDGQMGILFNTIDENTPSDAVPDYELYFVDSSPKGLYLSMNLTEEAYQQFYAPYENVSNFMCIVSSLLQKSRGTVRLRSTNPRDPPLVDPNYFQDPHDYVAVVSGMKECDRMLQTKGFISLGLKPYETRVPGCEHFPRYSDEYLLCSVKQMPVSINHLAGSNKMGDPNDPTTVVDPFLRVKGIQGLRVVDSSIMPIVTAGNTMAPTIMIGEKAADIIKQTITCTAE